jgi:hypothetical protein
MGTRGATRRQPSLRHGFSGCSFREKLRLIGRENSLGLPPPYVLTVRAAINVSASKVSAPAYGRQLPSEPLEK